MTPRKLAAVIKAHDGKFHPIAKALDVNVYWIHTYITKHREPRNPEIRARMFLPKLKKKQDGRSGFAELSPAVQWWRKLKKDERDQWIGICHNVHIHT